MGLVAAVFAEVGCAFFVEGGDAFFGFVGFAEDFEGGDGHGALGDEVFGVGVEGLFEDFEGGGGELEDFVGPGADFGGELVGGDDFVDQAPVEGLLGGVAAAEEPDFAGAFFADGAGEVSGSQSGVEGADAGSVLSEDGVFGGDGEVAEEVEDVSAADGDAVDGGDDGFGDVADDAVEGFDFEESAVGGAVVAGFHALFLVAAGAEGFVSGAGEGDGADVVAAPGVFEGFDEFVDGAGAECVVAVGSVDGDPGEAVVYFVGDVGEVAAEVVHVTWWSFRGRVRRVWSDRMTECSGDNDRFQEPIDPREGRVLPPQLFE